MDTNDQLSALFAAALEQQEAAKAAVDGIVQERAKLAVAIDSIKNTSSSLQAATGAAASKAVAESLNQAPKSAVAALKMATGALDEAADKVRNAGAIRLRASQALIKLHALIADLVGMKPTLERE